MGAYIREELVRMEMGAYIHGVPIVPILRYIDMQLGSTRVAVLTGMLASNQQHFPIDVVQGSDCAAT